jgi:hypothetical protein
VPASLREDYLNQVQRDFLSRTDNGPAPLADAPARPEREQIVPADAGSLYFLTILQRLWFFVLLLALRWQSLASAMPLD